MSSRSTPTERLFPIVFVTLVLAHVLLLVFQRIYPFVDLPNHLAIATIFRHYGQDGNFFNEYFTTKTLFQPNTFHMFFCSLKLFPSVEFANKVFYALYAILVPVSTLMAVKTLGGNKWFALLSFLVLFHYSVIWGFVGFTFGFPLFILLFTALVKYFRSHNIPALLTVMIFMPLLFFVHALTALFAIFLFCVSVFWFHRHSVRSLLVDAVAASPSFVVMLLGYIYRSSEGTGTLFEGLVNYFLRYSDTIVRRAKLPTFNGKHLYEGTTGMAVGLAFFLVVIIPIIFYIVRRYKDRKTLEPVFESAYIYPLVLCSLFACLFFPEEFLNNFLLYERFWCVFTLSLILLGSVYYKRGISRAYIAVICAAVLVNFALHIGYFKGFQEENKGFNADFLSAASVKREQTLTALIYNPYYRGFPVYLHYPCYYTIWNKGIALTKIADYSFTPLVYTSKGHSLAMYNEWVYRYKNYTGWYDNEDWILLRGEIPEDNLAYLDGFKKVRTAGAWSLYENIRLHSEQ